MSVSSTINGTFLAGASCTLGHHIVTPWIAKSDCDYLVDTGKLRGMQILGIIGISGPSVFMQGIIFERLIALARAKFYENSMFLVGPIIAFVSCIATGALVIYLFIDETFTEPTFSYVLIPSTSGPKMNYLCWGLLSANLIDLVANLAMEKINTCIRKR
ncbi:Protein CBG00892 [Caenorhabditis briggsae]|uniref:Protein CBG00892 n=1 Tax=Caenorhabditis briggsae TaxID=6238 RepID=A8WPD9_CAEBR|nr:Protein CBG00892 [Caenorhabditis briggsae]CAP22345.1 Protein CBG00892 [Caenorhabditis briggsae]